MTRKHFQKIADTIELYATTAGLAQDERLVLSKMFADMCKTENPRFQEERFLDACGCDEDEVMG